MNEKQCPCCSEFFKCLPGQISDCQCRKVEVAKETKDLLSMKYDSCLCNNCLTRIEAENKKAIGLPCLN